MIPVNKCSSFEGKFPEFETEMNAINQTIHGYGSTSIKFESMMCEVCRVWFNEIIGV